jgi:hypothetical protein
VTLFRELKRKPTHDLPKRMPRQVLRYQEPGKRVISVDSQIDLFATGRERLEDGPRLSTRVSR